MHASYAPWPDLRAAHQLLTSAAQRYDASMVALADLADPADFAALSVQTDLVVEAFVSACATWRAAVAAHEQADRLGMLEMRVGGGSGEASGAARAESVRLVAVALQAGKALYATSDARAELVRFLTAERSAADAARELASTEPLSVCEPALEAQALAELLAAQAAESVQALRELRVARPVVGPGSGPAVDR